MQAISSVSISFSFSFFELNTIHLNPGLLLLENFYNSRLLKVKYIVRLFNYISRPVFKFNSSVLWLSLFRIGTVYFAKFLLLFFATYLMSIIVSMVLHSRGL
jgi:hypothetical protein